jgi:hypothetical protein
MPGIMGGRWCGLADVSGSPTVPNLTHLMPLLDLRRRLGSESNMMHTNEIV